MAIVAPQQTDANFQVAAGALTDVQGNGQAAQVNVRNVVAARPQNGLPVALLDSQANRIVGKAPRAQVGQNDGTARLDIQETGQEVLWNLQMLNRSEYDVVTKVEYVDGKGLEITYERIKAWDQQKERVDTIPVVEQPVLTDIVDDRKGLRAKKRTIPVFSSSGDANAYFNTFRIGTFTGGWATGATKTVTQVWPIKGAQSPPVTTVTVRNLTQPVADTAETKYVLFAPRTQDAVPLSGLPSDDPSPIMSGAPLYDANGEYIESEPNGVNAPEVEYYAIEIQPASACTAFSSLNGLVVSALSGYSASAPAALSYATSSESQTPCLRWRSQLVPVLSAATRTPYGTTVTRKEIWVLADGAPQPDLVLPPTVRVGKVAADWPIGTCATVAIWEGIMSPGACVPVQGIGVVTGEISGDPGFGQQVVQQVANLKCNVLANSWVVIGRTEADRWYLISAGIEGSCRKTISGEDVTQWPGWAGNKVQLLGHDENGCLKWFDTTACEGGSGQ